MARLIVLIVTLVLLLGMPHTALSVNTIREGATLPRASAAN